MKLGPVESYPTRVPASTRETETANVAPIDRHVHLDQAVRFGRDAVSLLNDVKTAGVCAANLVKLPSCIRHYLGACNAGSLIGGAVGLGVDIFGARKVFEDPTSTRHDKLVDVAHMVLSDVVGTACGAIPLIASLTNPVMLALFIGGQAVAVASDIYKAVHDIKRERERHHDVSLPL